MLLFRSLGDDSGQVLDPWTSAYTLLMALSRLFIAAFSHEFQFKIQFKQKHKIIKCVSNTFSK